MDKTLDHSTALIEVRREPAIARSRCARPAVQTGLTSRTILAALFLLGYSIAIAGCAPGGAPARTAWLHYDACREAHADIPELCAEERAALEGHSPHRGGGAYSGLYGEYPKDWWSPPVWMEASQRRPRH
jgi:hypothetical protein